jgi:hypothetical protein
MRTSTVARSVNEEICRLQRLRLTILENEQVDSAVRKSEIVVNAFIAASISQKGIRQPQSIYPYPKTPRPQINYIM